MKPVYNLRKVSYNMHMRGGGDVWAIHGVCEERMPGRFMISTPIKFDKKKMLIETGNSIYKIESWGCSKYIEDKFWEQVEKDCCTGYEIH